MTSAERPRPDDQPDDNTPHEEFDISRLFDRDASDQETLGFAELIRNLVTAREALLAELTKTITSNTSLSVAIPVLQPLRRNHQVGFRDLVTGVLADFTDQDQLVDELSTIWDQEIDTIHNTLAEVSPNISEDKSSIRNNIRRALKEGAEVFLGEDADSDAKDEFAELVTEGFNDSIDATVIQALSDLPETPEIPGPTRTQIFLGRLGAAATEAGVIAAGVAAGIIIANKFNKK
jgi:uncharacterized protein (UPF0147 family)